MQSLPTLERYELHLRATVRWLLLSLRAGGGGSSAYFSPLMGWAKPYPETTGYLIPTLLELSHRNPEWETGAAARTAGEWLLSIQRPEGAWNGWTHPPRNGGRPSVFNTGQILKGLAALHRDTGERRWLDAALRGARWMAAGMTEDGLWPGGDYRARETPSYYTEALWPMLDVAALAGDDAVREAARGGAEAILARRRPNGAFAGWGFREDEPAFTHTIAYTLSGLLECGHRLGERDRWVEAALPAVEVLTRRSELAGGQLPGAFDEQWKPAGSYVCLTGNAQMALCLLAMEEERPDLRLVSAAARMVDAVCAAQPLAAPLEAVRGAVGGSCPLWGRYLRMRYPNWAAKYHCDALARLIARVRRELD